MPNKYNRDGNLSLTIEAYYGILYSGMRDKNDEQMRKARQFILSKGGLKKASMYTKFMLAMTGQYRWPAIFPIPLTDPSTPDLTGRTLEFLGNYANLKLPDHKVKQAVTQLLRKQENNGSWYGRWGICYIYGTWTALTGLMAAGRSNDDEAVQKAKRWLESIQNKDGGWGESCYSDIQRQYVPLGESTLTHTAWAVDALISISPRPTPEIEKGIDYLVKNIRKMDWTTSYPAGQGMAAFFYIHYHSYRYIFPLLGFGHYNAKYL
ncbi:squalene cyclase [Peribacillus cavernae]|nr:squalene cyclase [Peribacillus cavernae]